MKTQTGTNRGRKLEQGIALLVVLFALLLLSAIAMGMMYMADTENSVNVNYRDAQASFYAAQGGLQEARLRILNDYSTGNPRSPMGNIPLITPNAMPANGNATGVYYILNPKAGENIQPWNDVATNQYRDDELCKEQYGLTPGPGTAGAPCAVGTLPGGAGWYTAVASVMGNNGNVNYKWVRVTRKQNIGSNPFPVDGNPATTQGTTPICWDGSYELLLNGAATCEAMPTVGIHGFTTVYVVTSLGVTPTGARRMVTSEIALAPPTYANAAVDSQDHVTLNGQLTVNGYDNCSCQALMTCDNQGHNPGTGTDQCVNAAGQPLYVSRPGKTCDPTKYAIYAANTVDNPNSSESIFAPQNPPIAQNASWPFNIPDMIQQYQQNAINASTSAPYSYNCSPPTYTNGVLTANGNCGTQSGQTFGVPPTFPPSPVDNPVGPANMSTQVTYVPGNLQITASSVGNGVLIVDGDLDIHGGLQFYGLILVRGVVKFTGGGSQATNIFGAVLAGQESLVDNTLGGSAVIQFDQCSLSRRLINNPPVMIVQREVMY